METIRTEEDKLRTFSASQVNKFYSCPRMWAFEYIEGLKPPPSYAMKKGTFVHAVVEEFNMDPGALISGAKQQQKDELLERINEVARRLWQEGLPGEFADQMKQNVKKLKGQFENYVDTFLKRFSGVKRRTDLTSEQAWRKASPDANELSVLVTDEAGEWLFRGDIDAVYEKHPLWFDRTTIVDYKTGKSPFNAASPLSVDYSRQLDIYAWLYYQAFGHVPEVAGIHFLAEPPQSSTAFVFKEIDPGTIESVHLMLKRVRELTVSEELEDYPRNQQYKWCEFQKNDGSMIKCDHWDYCLGEAEIPPPPERDEDYRERKTREVVLRNPLEEDLILSEHANPVFEKEPPAED